MSKISKVAIVNEWIEIHGGAERVCMALEELFVQPADVFALWNDGNSIVSHNSFLQRVPNSLKKVKGVASLFVFRYFYRRKGYDLIISVSHLFAHTARFKKVQGMTRINYLLTPARYIWQPDLDSRFKIPQLFLRILRYIDLKSLNKDAVHVAISSEIKLRLKTFWGVDSIVIHPPVDIEYFENFRNTNSNLGGYLISGGRFVKYKNHNQAIVVASILKRKLVLAGTGPELENLESLAKVLEVDCEFYISPSREVLAGLFAGAAAFLHPAIEDFGIMPIEAMATGTPVIGIRAGGLVDSINDLSGVLVDNFEELPNAVLKAERLNRSEIARQSLKFSKQRFLREFRQLIEKLSN